LDIIYDDIFEFYNSGLFEHLVRLTLFSLMFSLGLDFSLQQFLAFWRKPGLVLRSLISTLVAFPLSVVLVLMIADLPESAVVGLIVLAAAPGAPLTTRRIKMAGGNFRYGTDLQVTLAALAIVTAPLVLMLFSRAFTDVHQSISPRQVALNVAIVQGLPMGLAVLLGWRQPGLAKAISEYVGNAANILFMVLVLVLFVTGIDLVMEAGWRVNLAISLVVVMALAAGHLLGGPDAQTRTALAIATIARNMGLALFITVLSGSEKRELATLAAYIAFGFVLAVPYNLWRRKTVPAS
jgi:BASS family bile acid:Na+ symporter